MHTWTIPFILLFSCVNSKNEVAPKPDTTNHKVSQCVIAIQLNAMAQIEMNYVDNENQLQMIGFYNAGRKDTTISKTLYLERATHFFYGNIKISKDGGYQVHKDNYLLLPGDTLSLVATGTLLNITNDNIPTKQLDGLFWLPNTFQNTKGYNKPAGTEITCEVIRKRIKDSANLSLQRIGRLLKQGIINNERAIQLKQFN